MKHLLFISFLLVLLSCGYKVDVLTENEDNELVLSTADSIIQLGIAAHGVKAFEQQMFAFTFRNKRYSFSFRNEGFKFNRIDTVSGQVIHDHFTESDFWREENGENISITTESKEKYKGSVNSVIYFTTLPYKLTDESVIASFKGTRSIKGKDYLVLEVRFTEEGGGEDHDDIFYYWFNSATHLLDYFAYSYHTNGGGVRFRSAYNRSEVGSVVFQDYINYEVKIGTPLHHIPSLYEKDSLKELSRIENKDIVIVP